MAKRIAYVTGGMVGIGTSITNTMLTAAAGMIQSTVDRIPDFGLLSVAIYRLSACACRLTCAWAR